VNQSQWSHDGVRAYIALTLSDGIFQRSFGPHMVFSDCQLLTTAPKLFPFRIPGIPPYRWVDPLLLPCLDAAVARGAKQQAAAGQKPVGCSKRTQRVAMRLVVHAQQLPHLLRDPD
jgi:hypothetical protein